MAGPEPTRGRRRADCEENIARRRRQNEENEEARRAEQRRQVIRDTAIAADPAFSSPSTPADFPETTVARDDHANPDATRIRTADPREFSTTTRRDAALYPIRSSTPMPRRLREATAQVDLLKLQLETKEAEIIKITNERDDALRDSIQAIMNDAHQETERLKRRVEELRKLLEETDEERIQLRNQLQEARAKVFELECEVDRLERSEQNPVGVRSRTSSSSSTGEEEHSSSVSQIPRSSQQMGRASARRSGHGDGGFMFAEIRWDRDARWFSRPKRSRIDPSRA